MYEYIKGSYKGFYKDYVVIENQGIGYKIYVPGSTLTKLPKVDDAVMLYTYHMVREDFIGLYGFISREELEMFLLLLGINGVGAKAALSIQSILDVERLKYAIVTADENSLIKAPGVGKKLAQRIILELKDKIKKERGTVQSINIDAVEQNFLYNDAIEALMALGYSEKECTAVLKKVDLSDTLEGIIKNSLKHLMS